MKKQIEILTPRLKLRPFRNSDAKDVQQLAGHKDISKMTLEIPHPYPDGPEASWYNGL